ncbi:MAG: Extracellular solute-binding protein [Candidatus Magasanikbacteria bacterium GW2011_GWA2_46_17]|uniref:Extracellular solute-binding protein n=1 Tax=Candidatus Magasanikbacteria bacterium GW2011_GWA2_46_17 TaxID=1619042 RepID=A0A0G1P334_9BACT|nr:MAG: Extracellular solute-binding protein [Candidatus Magasanikbacteria bacterium GW2011_GWA2_46_17]
MSWRTLISWFKDEREERVVPSSLDKKLIRNFQSRVIPNWSQIKYLGRFLSKKETYALISAVCVAVITGLVWTSIYLFNHYEKSPSDGGEYIEALVGQPKFINPVFASADEIDSDLASLVYSSLFRYDEQGRLVSDLASDYSISEDGKTYSINLRQDVRWSDGELFNADDLLFTFEVIQNPEVGSPLLPAFQGVMVEKTGDYAVRFVLKEPFAPFMSFLTVGILPEHVWSEVSPSTIKLAKLNLQPIGAGPWVFSKLVKDVNGNIQSYSLNRNENYYSKTPYLKTLTFKFFADRPEALNALRGQSVSAFSFIPASLKKRIKTKLFSQYQLRLPQYTALFFNQNQLAALKETEVRRALAIAIDREYLVKETLKNEAETINSPFLKGSIGYDASTTYPAFSVERANQLLDKHSKRIEPEKYFNSEFVNEIKRRDDQVKALREAASSTPVQASSAIAELENEVRNAIRAKMPSDQSFYRRDKTGSVLRLTITTVDSSDYEQVAEAVARMWRSVGIHASVNKVNSRQIVRETIKDRSYEVLLYGEITGSDPDPYPFWHSSQSEYPGMNLAFFTDRTADKLIEEARLTSDPDKRTESYKKFQKILIDEMPAVFLYTPLHTWAISKNFRGITVGSIYAPSDRYASLNNWYIKTKWRWK